MTPNVGVTCNVEEVRYGGLWTERAAMVPLTYVQAIARAGGRPLLLAPTRADAEDPSALLDLLDGVLITGGADVHPAAYGAAAHPETAPSSAERDAFELALVRGAGERDLPCLGVCRGMQVVNVAYGGALDRKGPTRWSATSTAARTASSPTTRCGSSRAASPPWPRAPSASRCAPTTTRGWPAWAPACA